MRVLYLISGINPPAGWGSEFIQNTIFKLADNGIQATIISPIFKHTPKNFNDWKRKIERDHRVKFIVFRSSNFYHSSLMATYQAIMELSREKYDIVHEFSSIPMILIRDIVFKLLFKTKIIYSLSVLNTGILGNIKWFTILNIANFYLLPSKMILGVVKKYLGRRKVLFSPPGIFVENFRKKTARQTARKALNLPQSKFIFSYYGTLTEEKGIVEIVKAARKLKSNPDILIAIYAIKRRDREYQIDGKPANIKIVHAKSNIPNIISASDCLLFPQKTGMGTVIPPISVIEAAASGKPTLALNTPGVSDILPSKNIVEGDLYAKMLEVYNSPNEFKLDPKKADLYNINKSVRLLLNTYEKAI